MPDKGTRHKQAKLPTHNYGSFAKTNTDLASNRKPNGQLSNDSKTALETDSGMSSEETDDDKVNTNAANPTGPSSVQKPEVITKCLIQEPQCALWNEIPCCSNVNFSFKEDRVGVDLGAADSKASDFIVIDLTRGSDKISCETSEGPNSASVVECDHSSMCSVDSSQTLVPIANNEIVAREKQKLVSLSLSILLAALLQAMRCFAEFLENFVVPQRQ